MEKLVVNVKKLNKRSMIPTMLPDNNNVAGIVFQNFTFIGEEVTTVPNPSIGKWFKDKDGYFYWGGGLSVLETVEDQPAEAPPQEVNSIPSTNGNVPTIAATEPSTTESVPEHPAITPTIKSKIQQVVNVFETGAAQGNYAGLVRYDDY